MPAARKWTDEQDDELRALRDAGKPRWQIAFTLGVSQKSVARRLARIDMHLRPWTLPDEMTLMRRAAEGASFTEIARELVRTPNAVSNKWASLIGTALYPGRRSPASTRARIPRDVKAEDTAEACEKHLQAILAANPRGFMAWSEKRVGVRGVAPCAPAFYPMKEAA